MKKKYIFTFAKRKVHKNKFYFFYRPLTKETMRQEKFVFFWWIGPYLWACQKVR